jgi:hypothetical protein
MSSSRFLLPVLAVCVLVRLAVLLFYPFDASGNTVTPDEWHAVAANLTQGRGYTVYAPQAGVYDWDLTGTPWAYRPTMRVPPVYPLVLAGIYNITGIHPLAGQLAQVLFDTLTAWIIYRIGWLLFDRRTGLLAALGWGLYAPEATHVLTLRSEPLFTLLVGAWVWTALSYRRACLSPTGQTRGAAPAFSSFRTPHSASRPLLLLSSLLLAITALCRPSMAGFGVIWGVWMGVRRRTAAPLAMLALLLAPWLVRGYVQFGTLVPVASNGGYSLYRSVFSLSRPAYISRTPPDFEAAYAAFKQTVVERRLPLPRHEADLDALFRDQAWGLIRAHPLRYMHLCAENALRLWFRLYGGLLAGWKDWATCLMNTGLLALMGAGLWRSGVRPYALLLALMACNTLFYAMTLADPRYNTPVIPLVMVLSAHGLNVLRQSLRTKHI